MRVSVVVCTYNRADSLVQTLACLRQQNYEEFEVVVVNGPSTDNTELLLAEWAGRIRLEQCSVANLSASRNIGIRAAGGDVVAFIDDDALPEFDWLQQAVPSFSDEAVAGVGGIVFDHTGYSLQYNYSAANRFGEVSFRSDRPYDEQCFPGTYQFPYLQGTNALFRRSALLRIGGFDETFDYYLDETDVCCRLIDAGFEIRQLANAPVHHKFLSSAVRNHQRVVTNWFPVMKNHTYFSYRHALGPFSEYEVQRKALENMGVWINDAEMHENAGRLPPGSALRARDTCTEAFRIGMQLGVERHGLQLGPADWEPPAFAPFPDGQARQRRKITLISSGYAENMTGGIARFITDLAPALAKRGHEVRVITKAFSHSTVDLESGVWVHRLIDRPTSGPGVAPNTFPHVNDFATAAAEEVARLQTWTVPDVVYGPMWDIEVLGVLDRTTLPVAVQMATPVAVAMQMAGHFNGDTVDARLTELMALERRIVEEADLFHANSAAVADTIRTSYVEHLDPARWGVVALGLADHIGPVTRRARGRLKVFFVGRFEFRKGIDTLLAVIERVAPDLPHVDFVLAGEDRPLSPGEANVGEQWMSEHIEEPWIDRVKMVGSVSDEQLHDHYRTSAVVVLPSRYESFGLVVLEAMIHGRAVVSCRTSGIVDVVQDGIDGVLVEPGDVDDLERALRKLISDGPLRRRLGTVARDRYVRDFHVDRFAERFDAFLDRVVMTRPRGDMAQSPVRLQAGEVFTMSYPPAQAARLIVTSDEPADVIVNGTTFALLEDRVNRLDLPATSTRIDVLTSSDGVAVHGVIGCVEQHAADVLQ